MDQKGQAVPDPAREQGKTMVWMKHSLVLLLVFAISGSLRAEVPNVLFLAVDDMNDWIGCLETTPRAITPNDLDDLPEKIKRIKTARSRIHKKLEDLDAIEDAIHGYLACMSYADAMMGRVLGALRASPHADNTIVVLWSDHGYHHGEKGDWGKHTLWERTSNVPFIWAGPGVAAGVKTDVTVSLIDIYPTLAEMCRLPKPHQDLEGQSLADTLSVPSAAKDRSVFLPHMNPGEYAIINRDWRYIRYGEDGEELYDVQADPNEWTNLASRPEYDDLKAEMRARAPHVFARPGTKLNLRKNLVIDGNTFRWEVR